MGAWEIVLAMMPDGFGMSPFQDLSWKDWFGVVLGAGVDVFDWVVGWASSALLVFVCFWGRLTWPACIPYYCCMLLWTTCPGWCSLQLPIFQ